MLFASAAEATWLPSADPRARHLRTVLRLRPGDPVFVGVANGPRGRATIVSDEAAGVHLDVTWEADIESLQPIRLLVGLPRPQTAKRLLFEAACLGVESLTFFGAERGEPSYAESKLWTAGEWERALWLGAEQAFATRIPTVARFDTLPEALVAEPPYAQRLALDVYEGEGPLSTVMDTDTPSATLAFGPERGWSASERDRLRGAGFRLAGLGSRVLRSESACVAAVSVVLAARGRM